MFSYPDIVIYNIIADKIIFVDNDLKSGISADITFLLITDTNTPDHPPIMPHFIQYSIIYLDNKNCRFVFEVWSILSSMTERMHGAFQFLVAS
jgi:hypothetical protein